MTTAMRGASMKGQSRPGREKAGYNRGHRQTKETTGMRRAVLAASIAAIALSGPAAAQDQAAVYQQKKAFRFAGDSIARYEWTQDIPTTGSSCPDEAVPCLVNEDRYLLQARPRLELTMGPVELGVGGAFNYSEDENDVPPPGQSTQLIIRDNFRSRDARLDLAWGKLTLGPVVLEGGRFLMPLPFTEMIWDRDLRPQGGAAAVQYVPKGSASRFALQGIYATGSHVYEDESVMYGGGVDLKFASAQGSSLQLAGSYLQFEDLNKLEPRVRRQNTRVAGLIVHDYHVVDLVARITRGGQVPLELVANYAWNTAVDQDGHGLWLAASLGNVGVSRASLAYTYAKVDKDATAAAFSTDDFFWGTGWEGHRLDLATGTVKSSSLHGIAQRQRFKDSPDPDVREQWVTRYRIEWRTSF
jgi:hypothetical protein